jgi:class 3 adenylate cyclase
MHGEFLDLLDDAIGVSEFIIAINLDIRGFSAFSMNVESSETAIFLKKVYKKLITDYFTDASFFKPTGDGLLVIIKYTEGSLKECVTNSISTCLSAIKDFDSLLKDDPMINFEVPNKIGIGLSRGAACSLVADGRILDYSGRVINLASRLMDLARPSGIIFDEKFGIDLLPAEISELFTKEEVYFKGIAEREPVVIYYTHDYSMILEINRQPIEKTKWQILNKRKNLKEIKLSKLFIHRLPSEPIYPSQIKVKIIYPLVVEDKKIKGKQRMHDFNDFEFKIERGKPCIVLNYAKLAAYLISRAIKDNWEIQLEIIYPEKIT